MKHPLFLLASLLACVGAIITPAGAAINWMPDGILVHTGLVTVEESEMVYSGAYVYTATRLQTTIPTTQHLIALQKIDRCGNLLWGNPGVVVSAPNILGDGLSLVADGYSGVVVAWGQNGDIYVQRIDASGTALWTANGVPVADSADDEGSPKVTHLGGIVVSSYRVAWQNNTLNEIYAQNLDLLGAETWLAGDFRISAQTADEFLVDYVQGIALYYTTGGTIDFYVQKVSPVTPDWGANGTNLGTSAATTSADIVYGPNAGVWVAYEINSGVGRNIRAVYVNKLGLLTEAHEEGNSSYDEYDPLITWLSDGAQIAYTRLESGDEQAIMHTVDNGGTFYLLGPGNAGNQRPRAIQREGVFHLVVVWEDDTGGSIDLYAERIDPNHGVPFKWNFGAGIPLTTAPGDQIEPRIAATRPVWADGDFYFSWIGPPTDLYAQRVDGATGVFGHPEIKIEALQEPDGDDEGGSLAFEWIKSQLDGQPFVHPEDPVTDYTIWRAVDVLPMYPPDPICPQPSAGATGSTPCDWELVQMIDAGGQESYFEIVPTTRDVAPGDPAMHYFVVLAHDTAGNYYTSDPDSAASHDEIPPGNPVEFYGEQIGNYVYLHWLAASGPDVAYYNIRRNIPGTITSQLIGTSTDLMFTDESPNMSVGGNYKAAAVDDNGNEGPYSPEFFVSPNPTGVGNDAPLRALQVRNALPNPFTVSTSFSVGVPRDGDVAIDVFDVAGRRVRHDVHRAVRAGWHTFGFDSVDGAQKPLASGVYFYRVTVGGETATRKIVVTR